MEHYHEYGKVEKHLLYSKRLHSINERGARFLREIEAKKRVGGRRKYQGPVYTVHHLFENILKPRLVLCNNLYSSLMFYMDEMLFYEVRGINSFVIEDDAFPLSFVYFNQCEWNPEFGQTHAFELDVGPNLSDTEAALLSILVKDYETVLQDVLHDILTSGVPVKKEKAFVKLIRIIHRLKRRLTIIQSTLLQVITAAESNLTKN